MDLFLFNEFIEWIDTSNEWMVYLVINAKSITPAIQRVCGDKIDLFLTNVKFLTVQHNQQADKGRCKVCMQRRFK